MLLESFQIFQNKLKLLHCVKSVQIRRFFWSVFSRIRTEYRVSLRIQSEYGKIRTRKNRYLDTFHTVLHYVFLFRSSKKLDLRKLMEIEVKYTPRLLESNNLFTHLFIIYYYKICCSSIKLTHSNQYLFGKIIIPHEQRSQPTELLNYPSLYVKSSVLISDTYAYILS